MPLRCHDEFQHDIYAFDVGREVWRELTIRNQAQRHLRMPCCAALVTLKTSPRGTQYFAHKAKGMCATAPETEAHLRLKQIAVEEARSHGWEVQSEASGQTPSGERWVADVLARKGKAAVAIEIQWSPQTVEETLRRQERYKASGVRGLWLVRKTFVPSTALLPVALITAGPDNDYMATLSSGQMMTARSLLDAAFSKRLKFGVPRNATGTVAVHVCPEICWRDSCRAKITIITRIEVAFGPYSSMFSLADFTDRPELFRAIAPHIPKNLGMGAIKSRHSKTGKESYLSNGCPRCDSLFGQYMTPNGLYEQELACSVPIRNSGDWQEFFLSCGRDFETWAVFQLHELPQSNL